MPTCSKGKVTKTVNGTITLTALDGKKKIDSKEIKDKSASDVWDNCKCPEGQEIAYGKCITANVPEKGEKVTGSFDIGLGFTIAWDLTVDSDREITNCEYECKPKPD